MAWSRSQAKMFAKDLHKEWGQAIPYLGTPVLRAACAEKALSVVNGQSAETLKVEDIQQLTFMIEEEFDSLIGGRLSDAGFIFTEN